MKKLHNQEIINLKGQLLIKNQKEIKKEKLSSEERIREMKEDNLFLISNLNGEKQFLENKLLDKKLNVVNLSLHREECESANSNFLKRKITLQEKLEKLKQTYENIKNNSIQLLHNHNIPTILSNIHHEPHNNEIHHLDSLDNDSNESEINLHEVRENKNKNQIHSNLLLNYNYNIDHLRQTYPIPLIKKSNQELQIHTDANYYSNSQPVEVQKVKEHKKFKFFPHK
jgi:hypothetical protein